MKWIILLILIIPLVSGASSENYAIHSLVISGGGTNTSSSNYQNNLLVGDIAGTTNSSNYNMELGFWYSKDYNPSFFEIALATGILIGLLGTAFFLLVWARKLSEEHKPMKILFMLSGLFLILPALSTLNTLSELDISGTYNIYLWAFITFIFIFFITIFFKYIKNIK